jgi:hypothetical protein
MEDLRRIQVMVDGRGWVEFLWSEVKDGDTFRMVENNGAPVFIGDESEFYCCKDAYQTPAGVWCVETKDEEE